MISVELARQLQGQKLEWTPKLHDKFMIPDRDLGDQVFVIAELTIDVEELDGHATIMFNGAVEWSLDYIFSQEVVWLPSEEQLRDLLGASFVTLTRGDGGFRCEIDVDGMTVVFSAADASDAYGQALLHLLYADNPDAVQVDADGGPPGWIAPVG
jgi:hypothetical protein